jgi:hypothetical protein
MVGVASAGKTTLLAVVSAAYQASGCRVVGNATSEQAARTLGREAELGESRTLASLLWRVNHDRLVLDERSVVILDEVGMTEDAHTWWPSRPASRPPAPSWRWSATPASWGWSARAGARRPGPSPP